MLGAVRFVIPAHGKFCKIFRQMSPKQLGITIAANSNMHYKERDLGSWERVSGEHPLCIRKHIGTASRCAGGL
jgi:hypothetical protein